MTDKSIKREKFIRLAESRTNKAIRNIELIGNLSNNNYYDYTPEQVEAVFSAIQSTVTTQKRRFSASINKKRKFRL